MKTKHTLLLPDWFKRTFVTLSGIAYILNILTAITIVAYVYHTRPVRVSQFMVFMVTGLVLPLVLFVIGLMSYRRNRRILDRLFTAMVVAITGGILQAVLVRPLFHLPFATSNLWVTWGSLVPTLLAVIIVAAGVYLVRSRTIISLRIVRGVVGVVLFGGFVWMGSQFLFDTFRYTLRSGGNTALSDGVINLSAYVVMLLIVLGTWLLVTRRAHWTNHLYVSASVAIAGGLIWYLLQGLMQFGTLTKTFALDSASPNVSWALLGLSLVGYAVLIVCYKRSKKSVYSYPK